MIDIRIPRNLEGKSFAPYWFSDTSLSVTKKEKEDFSKCDAARANLHVSQERNIVAPSHGHLHFASESYNGLSTGDGITEKESDQLGLPITLAITSSPPKRVQSWIDNQKSASPSSIESSSSLFSTENLQLVSSSKTVEGSSKKTNVLRFANEGELESKISTVKDSSSSKEKTYSNTKQSESESVLECGRDSLVRQSVKTSPLTIVEESDVEAVSSSTTASSTRVQPRINQSMYEYLTPIDVHQCDSAIEKPSQVQVVVTKVVVTQPQPPSSRKRAANSESNTESTESKGTDQGERKAQVGTNQKSKRTHKKVKTSGIEDVIAAVAAAAEEPVPVLPDRTAAETSTISSVTPVPVQGDGDAHGSQTNKKKIRRRKTFNRTGFPSVKSPSPTLAPSLSVPENPSKNDEAIPSINNPTFRVAKRAKMMPKEEEDEDEDAILPDPTSSEASSGDESNPFLPLPSIKGTQPKKRRNSTMRKRYLPAGLLSNYFKEDSETNSVTTSVAAAKVLTYEPDEHEHGLLPAPFYCERFLRRTKRDFQLPFDLWWLHQQGKLPGRDNLVPSWNYKKNRTNIYYDVKPPFTNDLTDGVLKKDEQLSESDNDSRSLTPKLGGDNELVKVRMNTRCKKKINQISSSSDNLSTAASNSGSSPEKKKKKALVTIESDSESPNDKFNIDPVGRLDGTPPIEEPPSSNYQTPIQEEQHIIPADEFKTNFRKAAIKRKLYMDEQTVNSPKSKRIPLDSVQNGRTVLPKIIEMLKKHSNNLRTRDRFAAKHCEELDRCIEDVFFSHQRVNQNLTDDQLDTAIVDKVKLGYI